MFNSKEEYEMSKKIDTSDDLSDKAMECRYCNKEVDSYTDRAWIMATFNENCKWGYNGKTLRICACKGIDPLNREDAKKEWVVYNNYGDICDVNPYSESMMKRGADISDGYRYKLHRIWDPNMDKILFIMINPSTADTTEDDKTIKLLVEITKKWENYGGFYVGNLYPHISSKPVDLKTIQIPDEIHAKNRTSIEEMASECSLIVYAWGTKGPDERQKEPDWLRNIIDKDVHCLGMSVKGVPKHPKQWGSNVIPPVPMIYRSKV